MAKGQDDPVDVQARANANRDSWKLARDFQVSEMNYRRAHRWNIFAWAGGLLLGSTGIVFALASSGTKASSSNPSFPVPQKIFLILAIIVLVVIALLWLKYHYDREMEAKDIISILDGPNYLNLYAQITSGETTLNTSPYILINSGVALVFLALFSILALLYLP